MRDKLLPDKTKILIVDDTADTVELLTKRFRAEGYETEAAYDGEEGLRRVKEFWPDLLVLDVMMPKLDGYEVCRRLKKNEETRYIPILMLTAKSDVPDKIKGLDTGADDYLTKPFDYKELAARVRTLLAQKSASREMAREEKSEALGQMLDEVAHEVRNPLVAIGGFARRVKDNLPADSANHRYMEIILQNVAALEKMVEQLFEVKSTALIYVEPCRINEIIAKALEVFKPAIAKNNIVLHQDLPEESPLISASRGKMTRAISCLIENAIEAMEGEKRELSIQVKSVAATVEISISDTGKGISRETRQNIFNPFFSSKIYGPGLGLTFVLKTVQNHKGSLTVESEENIGTKFTVKLPLRSRGR